ncbi:MAG: 16S rRNA (cytidine(1402)-2'-O)-methyltransferase [Polyangiales bacterium]
MDEGSPDRGAPSAGKLSILATPIGNLQDITLRALAALREADLILAEDTRNTRKLLSRHGVSTGLRALHAHSSDAAIERCLKDLEEGKRLALVTDAGTPLISDPGAKLVAAAHARAIAVESVPGPSAVVAALSVCGLPFDSFRFAGFAPRTGSKREAWLERIAADPDAAVFFEAPTRLAATLRDLSARLHPGRGVAVCRELTKVHEEVVRGTATELAERFARGTRGEVTVVIAAGDPAEPDAPEEAARDLGPAIAELLARGLSPRDVARTLARETGLARREIYGRVLASLKTGPSRPTPDEP